MIDYRQTGGRIYRVDLNMPAAQRWLNVSRRLKEDINALIVIMKEEGSKILPNWLYRALKVPVRVLYELVGEEYVIEIQSIAKAVDVDFADLLLANLSYEIGHNLACSSYSFNLRGKPVLVRNLDWGVPASLGSRTIVIQYFAKRHDYYAVTFPGFVGILSAFSPRRWALTVNAAPKIKRPHFTQLPALMLTRFACDRSAAFNSLRRNLARYDSQTSFFAHLIGTKSSEHCVIEKEPGGYWTRGIPLPLILTNHYALDGDSWDEESEAEIKSLYTHKRYRVLEKRLKKPPRSMMEALGKLKGQLVTHESTQQSMVFNPATNRWILKIRP